MGMGTCATVHIGPEDNSREFIFSFWVDPGIKLVVIRLWQGPLSMEPSHWPVPRYTQKHTLWIKVLLTSKAVHIHLLF